MLTRRGVCGSYFESSRHKFRHLTFPMQTLRKKNSPCKFKKEPTRFLGEGVSFKAKLIGILEVSEARGDRMCQAALADLKMAIRAAGEHKQRIAVQVSIDGLRLRDEKTGECLYHHPVHKISFIAQDMSDSRAFGYIFGSPDTGHRFFGIKTDKAANQVVIAMRDLFQVVFELKKKEIELTKQNMEQNSSKFHISGIFVEPAPDTKGAAGTESCLQRIRTASIDADKASSNSGSNEKKCDHVIADLLDLQFELNSLQQGIHQMDKITPDNPRPSSEDPFESDPFGDSFANMKVTGSVQPILPPPPFSSKRGHLERQQTIPATPSSVTSSPAPHQVFQSSKTPPPEESIKWLENESEKRFSDGEIASLTNVPSGDEEKENGSTGTSTSLRKSPQIDVFTELDPLGTGLSKPYIDKKDFFQHLKNPPKKVLKDLVTTNSGETFPTNFDLTLDPLDPIKVRSDVTQKSTESFEDGDFANFEKFDNETEAPVVTTTARVSPSVVAAKTDSPQQLSHRSNQRMIHHQPLSVSLPPEESPVHHKPSMLKESGDSIQSLIRLPSPKKYQSMKKKELDMELSSSRMRESVEKSFPVDFSKASEMPASPLRSCSSDANSRLSSSSAELDIVPEPPPRGAASILINPPPLPPKKQGARGGSKPPPRPPHTDSHLHYDFIERRETSPSPTRRERTRSPGQFDDGKPRFDDNFSPPSPRTLKRCETSSSASSNVMQASRFDNMTPTTLSNLFRNPYMSNVSGESTKITATSSAANTTTTAIKTKPSLDITLSQLTSSNLDEFATSLDMSVAELTNLTLQQLTECLARLSAGDANGTNNSARNSANASTSFAKSPPTSAKLVETSFVSSEPLFKADFDQGAKHQNQQPDENPVYDKYAVFRELLEMEQLREESAAKETEDASPAPEEQFDDNKETTSTFSITGTIELKDRLVGLSSLLSMGNLSVELPPLNEQSSKREMKAEVTLHERTEPISEQVSAKEASESDIKSPHENRIDFQGEGELSARQKRPLSGTFENNENKTKSFENVDTERVEVLEKKSQEMKVKIPREEVERGEEPGEVEEEEDEEEEDDEDEEEEDEEEEEEDQETAGNEELTKKTTSESKLATAASGTKDRYAALREIGDESEPKSAEVEEMPPGSLVTSPIQQQTPKTLAEHDLLKLFSEPVPDRVSPRKTPSRNEEDLRAVSSDIFEEIRMLNSGGSQSQTGSRTSKEGIRPATTGFEDVFCPFPESKQESKDGRESTGSVKDEGNWAKFESSGVFNSDKSSYEDPVSIGGTSPWSPDEKDFQTPEGGVGEGKATLKMQQQQHRLHSGESDNEWKDEEESEESNGRRQFRDDPGYWCGRHPRFDMSEEGPYYDEPGEKERHFYERERDRGSRKSRGGPWPKQPGTHRARDSSPWHEEPASRGWPRDEDDQHSIQRGRYPTGRKQMPGNLYKDEEEESSKGYWKCRTKQRAWNGDREGFRNPNQQPGQQPPSQPPHFPGDPMFYEDDRAKRRMMLWSEDREEERERDRFSSQESMGYDEEERWPRREYDRRRDRWEEETVGGSRFWPRRGGPGEGEPRGDMRLDPRSEYGPPPPHELYRKQHYCRPERGDHRERPGVPHEMYPQVAPGGTGCWPEDEYSLPLPLPDRPDNSPRYLTRKRHWPKRPNSANDERNMAEPVYADPRIKYGMSRSECSDNDSEHYHRPYRSRSRESYWGSDQEFESWPGGGSGNERLYWSEGPDAKSESLHRRRMNRHKTSRPTSQKSQSSPFEDDFTESIDRIEPSFESFTPDGSRGVPIDMEVKQPTTPRNVKEHLRKDPRGNRYGKQTSTGSRASNYSEKESPSNEGTGERVRIPSDLKSTPEDFPTELGKGLATSGEAFVPEESPRDSFFNGNPSPGFDDDAFAFKSEMADSVPETTTASMSLKNSRQIKYGNNKMKGDHDIKKSESVNIFVRESDPFDDDDFFK